LRAGTSPCADDNGPDYGGSATSHDWIASLYSMKNLQRAVRFASRRHWRRWLERNHSSKVEALLIICKRPRKNQTLSANAALEEALCFGWIDGWFKPIDDRRWVIRYTPRRKGSNWSMYNVARAWKLLNEGRMTPAGISKLPEEVLLVWERYSPRPIIAASLAGAQEKKIEFEDGKDYLSMIRLPVRSP